MKIYVYIILSLITLFSFAQTKDSPNFNNKGLYIEEFKTNESLSDNLPITIRTNSRNAFANVKQNNIIAFLAGNNDYAIESHFENLSQSINDIKLLSAILIECCKVPKNNIITSANLTAIQFRQEFKKVIKNLKKGQALLFYYSGHGDTDGSLVMTDGEKITPKELKALIKSFNNDTIIILDACYSGNNEGPLEMEQGDDYKDNSIRIYSSLAHMTAKEISYNNRYFNAVKSFYENVLELKDNNIITGNSYFTALIGYFFAEFNFDKNENISFNDLLSYITNKGKQYVEFLVLRGQKGKVETNPLALFLESSQRLNQQPKILPLNKKVKYLDPNHNNILIKKYIQPIGLMPELHIAPLIGFTTLFSLKPSVYISLRLSYMNSALKGLSFGIETGYFFTYRNEDLSNNLQGVQLNLIPIIGNIGYKYEINPVVSLQAESGAGITISIWDFKKYLTVLPQTFYTSVNFCFQSGLGIGLHPVKNLTLGLDIQVFGLLLDENNLFIGLKFPVSVNYKF